MKIPKIAMGTGGIMKHNNELFEMISAAKESKIKHIDTAYKYFNEKQLGIDLKKLKWNDVFITSKIYPGGSDFDTRKTVEESLGYIGKKIDMLLIHGPVNKETNIKVFKELLKMRDEGLIASVGVSNFSIDEIKEVYEATNEYPVNNQIYITPTYFDKELIEYCQSNNIIVSAYSTLGCYFRDEHKFSLSKDEKKYIDSLSEKYSCSVSNILFAWLLNQGINVVFQSRKAKRIKENMNNIDIKLTKSEIEK